MALLTARRTDEVFDPSDREGASRRGRRITCTIFRSLPDVLFEPRDREGASRRRITCTALPVVRLRSASDSEAFDPHDSDGRSRRSGKTCTDLLPSEVFELFEASDTEGRSRRLITCTIFSSLPWPFVLVPCPFPCPSVLFESFELFELFDSRGPKAEPPCPTPWIFVTPLAFSLEKLPPPPELNVVDEKPAEAAKDPPT